MLVSALSFPAASALAQDWHVDVGATSVRYDSVTTIRSGSLSPQVEYEYAVAGIQYHGDRYSFAPVKSSVHEEMTAIITRLAPGTPSPRGDTPGSWRTGLCCGSRRGRVLVMDRDVARPAAQVLSGADWQTFCKSMEQTDLYYEFTVED